MANIIVLQQTCEACPEQYWAYKGAHIIGYIRLRWGHLTCDYLPKGKFTDDDTRVLDKVFNERADDKFKGSFDSDEEREFWLNKCTNALIKEIQRNKINNGGGNRLKRYNMARTKQRKVGDRIFYEKYDGTIGTCLIKDITDDEYVEPQGRLNTPKVVKFKRYKTGKYEFIEDYICLSDNDPRVKEFCKGKKFITSSLKDELIAWLGEHGCHQGDTDVAEILNEVTEYFE